MPIMENIQLGKDKIKKNVKFLTSLRVYIFDKGKLSGIPQMTFRQCRFLLSSYELWIKDPQLVN